MSKPARCRDCGTNQVAWKQSKAGRWYLADTRPARTLGYTGDVARGPHYLTCDQSVKKAEDLAAAQRQFEADAWMFMDPEERHYARQERLEAEYEEENA